jgi:hypothetical protein
MASALQPIPQFADCPAAVQSHPTIWKSIVISKLDFQFFSRTNSK